MRTLFRTPKVGIFIPAETFLMLQQHLKVIVNIVVILELWSSFAAPKELRIYASFAQVACLLMRVHAPYVDLLGLYV